MINKDETLNNAKFNENCRKFGLQSGFIDKIGETIVVTLINNGIRVIFNDKFDVIGIHATSPEYSYGIACDLANIYDKNYRYKSDRFVYPFDELSFKNISDIADIFSVLKTNYNIKLFNKLNDEFKGDKLDLICENGMQEVYDLGSKISKKCHDIMIMEIIYKEQLRNYEEAKEYEESDMSNKKLNVSKYCVETSQKQENDFEQDLDSHGFQPKLRR